MIIDLLRWAKEVASDATNGVNAQLASVPRDAPEPAPGAVEIFTPLETEWVGRGTIPREQLVDGSGNPRRLLVLMLHPDPEGFQTHALPEFEENDPTIISLVAMYACRKIEKAGDTTTVASQVRDGRQILRALTRTYAKKFDSAHTVYERNDCVISLPARPGFTLNSQFMEVSADLVTDFLILPFRVLDRWALGVT